MNCRFGQGGHSEARCVDGSRACENCSLVATAAEDIAWALGDTSTRPYHLIADALSSWALGVEVVQNPPRGAIAYRFL